MNINILNLCCIFQHLLTHTQYYKIKNTRGSLVQNSFELVQQKTIPFTQPLAFVDLNSIIKSRPSISVLTHLNFNVNLKLFMMLIFYLYLPFFYTHPFFTFFIPVPILTKQELFIFFALAKTNQAIKKSSKHFNHKRLHWLTFPNFKF